MPPTWRGLVGPAVWREARAPAELRALRQSQRELDGLLQPGDGQPIVLSPGYLAGPSSMFFLERWLGQAGYDVALAATGRNMRSSSWACDRITDAIVEAAERAGGPVIVIGHSRGGQQARVAVTRVPQHCEQLITLGAPIRHHLPRGFLLRTSVEGLRLLGRTPIGPDADLAADRRYAEELAAPFPDGIPWASIFSRSDGVVEWQATLDPAAESVEVDCTHVGLTASLPAFRAIARALLR